ncbi:MAG: threonine/serine dehydratase [Acidobacteriia bacterium]|nr:threonine/serine dehydratase [Terriglobia bacterium]
MVTLDDITLAATRLRGIAARTPLIPYPRQRPSRELYLKPESLQPIGSFKLRGAFNKIASLSDAERRNGVISYSSGNHAQGVAYAARALGVSSVIVMPGNAPQIKIDSTRALGAEIVFVGPASSERKAKAEDLAREHGYVIIPPYNDEKIIAGAGTAGLEILADLPDAETVLVPVGGGGLISGVAAALKLSGSTARIIGVEPELASDAQASFRSGHIVEFSADQTSRTLADGLRTQSVGEINFAHIRRFVDDIVTVTESEILDAVRGLALDAKLVAEPSGAVTFAAFLFRDLPAAQKTVALISGGNIDPALLARVLSQT